MRRVLSRRFCRGLIVRCGFNGGVRVGHGLTTSTVTGAPDLFLVQLCVWLETRGFRSSSSSKFPLKTEDEDDDKDFRTVVSDQTLLRSLTLLKFADEVTVFSGLLPA